MISAPTIIIVEDEMIIALDLQTRLRRLCCEVLATVTSGEEAIALVAATRPDLVFMDIGLSGELDGIAAAQQIQAHATVPIVFLSAYVDAQTRERIEASAPAAFITKPFSEAELRHVIQTLLGR